MLHSVGSGFKMFQYVLVITPKIGEDGPVLTHRVRDVQPPTLCVT